MAPYVPICIRGMRSDSAQALHCRASAADDPQCRARHHPAMAQERFVSMGICNSTELVRRMHDQCVLCGGLQLAASGNQSISHALPQMVMTMSPDLWTISGRRKPRSICGRTCMKSV
jgi:hypothetical protein